MSRCIFTPAEVPAHKINKLMRIDIFKELKDILQQVAGKQRKRKREKERKRERKKERKRDRGVRRNKRE